VVRVESVAIKYKNEKPFLIMEPLKLRIPCGSDCIKNFRSEFNPLLNYYPLNKYLEAIDELSNLINIEIENLRNYILPEFRPEKLDDAIYILYNIIINGEELKFSDFIECCGRKFFMGEESYNKVVNLSKEKNVKEICKHIFYFYEALWENVEKNISRELNKILGKENEVKNRS
jgi:hypothetical protein